METTMLDRALERFDVYLPHHPASGVDFALDELLKLSRDYLPELTTFSRFESAFYSNNVTPNNYVDKAIFHLLSESSLFRLACEKVIEERDVQEVVGEKAEATAAAQEVVGEKAEATAAAQEAVAEVAG